MNILYNDKKDSFQAGSGAAGQHVKDRVDPDQGLLRGEKL
jgi:hypothetical protein